MKKGTLLFGFVTLGLAAILTILLTLPAGTAGADDSSILSLMVFRHNTINDGPCKDGGPQMVGNWQRCPGGRRTWAAANSYCANLIINGSGGFHLPSKDQLKSLVRCTNGHPTPLEDYANCAADDYGYDFESPTISDDFVCGTSGYWTSTYFGTGGSVDFYWYVEFDMGASGYHSEETTFYVRCTR